MAPGGLPPAASQGTMRGVALRHPGRCHQDFQGAVMLEDLQRRFPAPGVRFVQRDQLVLVELENAHGSATVTPFGATLLSYVPRGGEEVIWVSETARYDGAKPVRGGVPVCWPWFGPHPDDAGQRAHGVARYVTWEVEAVASRDDTTQAVFRLEPEAGIRAAWPEAFTLRLAVTLGERLVLELTGENRSDRDWTVSEALHTYFRVTDARNLEVEGLAGLRYADKVAGGRQMQHEPLRVAAPMDRVYLGHHGGVTIHDAHRRIRVDKSDSASTVVWNPGPEGAKAFPDMPDDDWVSMVCVEAANALDNAYTLPAGAAHTLSMAIGVE